MPRFVSFILSDMYIYQIAYQTKQMSSLIQNQNQSSDDQIAISGTSLKELEEAEARLYQDVSSYTSTGTGISGAGARAASYTEDPVMDAKAKIKELEMSIAQLYTEHVSYLRNVERNDLTAAATNRTNMISMNTNILNLIRVIQSDIAQAYPNSVAYQLIEDMLNKMLNGTIDDIKVQHEILQKKLLEDNQFIGKDEVSHLEYKSSKYVYVTYFVFTLLLVVVILLSFSTYEISGVEISFLMLGVFFVIYQSYSTVLKAGKEKVDDTAVYLKQKFLAMFTV